VSISPDIGYRFAGYVDGEGHFAITRNTKPRTGTVSYGVGFAMHVRADDRAVIERYRKELGDMGRFYEVAEQMRSTGYTSRPTVMWQVNRKRDCLTLVSLFETYTLWTKKAIDFHIWAKATRYMNGPKPEGWAPMARWFDEIRAVRVYDSPEFALDLAPPALLLFDDEELASA